MEFLHKPLFWTTLFSKFLPYFCWHIWKSEWQLAKKWKHRVDQCSKLVSVECGAFNSNVERTLMHRLGHSFQQLKNAVFEGVSNTYEWSTQTNLTSKSSTCNVVSQISSHSTMVSRGITLLSSYYFITSFQSVL